MTNAATTALIATGAAIGGGLVSGLLSGAYQHLRDLWSRPLLALDLPDDGSCKVESPHKYTDGTTVGHVYVRVRIRNTGKRIAKNCHVYLANLSEVHPSNETTKTVFLDSRPVAWAGFKFVGLDLPTELKFFADIASVSKAESGWCFSVEQLFASEESLKSYRGTYRFSLMVTADNAAPKKCEVDVTYDGNWNNLRAVLVTRMP